MKMGEGGNLLIVILCINIFLFIGLNGMGSGQANLVKTSLFTDSGILTMQGDEVGLGNSFTEKPELKSTQVESDVLSLKSFDALEIAWNFIIALLNIITLPFTLAYNLFVSSGVVGQMISLMIFAPLSVAYVYALFSFIKGVGN